MKKIIKLLQNQSVISHKEVTELQIKLKEDYPEYTTIRRAQLFAREIQNRLDHSLAPFELKLKKSLKFYLLKQTIYRENFSINAYDVVDSYLKVEDVKEQGIMELTNWLNQYDDFHLSVQEVSDLTASFFELQDELEIENSNIPTLLEETLPTKPSPMQWLLDCSKPTLFFLFASFTAFCISLGAFIFFHFPEKQYTEAFNQISDPMITCPISLDLEMFANYLQIELQYRQVDTANLKAYLNSYHSLLAQEPYFSSIIEAAKEFNVNPLLLFAITGQEQGFVPIDHAYAKEIANNPFNVYGSWQSYNTTIKQSARIAAETLIHLGKGCPEDEDQIKWINTEYAADPQWHVGVTYFFNAMSEVALLEDKP